MENFDVVNIDKQDSFKSSNPYVYVNDNDQFKQMEYKKMKEDIASAVTKESLGLDKVENTPFVDQVHEYPTAQTLTDIVSATDNMKITFGKIALAIKAFIQHVSDIATTINNSGSIFSNKRPHITEEERIYWNSKSNAAHSHSFSDVSGTLGVSKGGTGVTTIDALKTALGIPSIPLAVLSGGTGATNAAKARENLGLKDLFKTETWTTTDPIYFNAGGSSTNMFKVTINWNAPAGYVVAGYTGWAVTTSGISDQGYDDNKIFVNNIWTNGNNTDVILSDTSGKANACNFKICVLYLKNI